MNKDKKNEKILLIDDTINHMEKCITELENKYGDDIEDGQEIGICINQSRAELSEKVYRILLDFFGEECKVDMIDKDGNRKYVGLVNDFIDKYLLVAISYSIKMIELSDFEVKIELTYRFDTPYSKKYNFIAYIEE